MLTWIIAILIIIFLIGFLPVMPYNASRTWGWWPSGIFGFLLVVFIVALLLGAI